MSEDERSWLFVPGSAGLISTNEIRLARSRGYEILEEGTLKPCVGPACIVRIEPGCIIVKLGKTAT